jgi:Mg-chelatase subunit ChlD
MLPMLPDFRPHTQRVDDKPTKGIVSSLVTLFVRSIVSVNANQNSGKVNSLPEYKEESMSPMHRPHSHRVYDSDRIALVGFNDRGFVISPPRTPHEPLLQQRVANLHNKVSGQFTNMSDGLRKALSIIERVPRGVLRRCWLLTDGYPNPRSNDVLDVARQAYRLHCNIMCIGFGNPDNFDEQLLRNISAATHNGKYVSVQSLTELTNALVSTDTGTHRRRRHRAETSVLVIDLSGSMTQPMGDATKIAVVEESILKLLYFKQQMFS